MPSLHPRRLAHLFLVPCLVAVGCARTTSPTVDAGPPTDAGAADARDAGPPEPPPVERIADRAVVAFVGRDALGPWWIEERIAGQPLVQGDRELGPRSLVRATPERQVVWAPAADDRMTDAVLHPSGAWSAVGVDATMRPFLVRGDVGGALVRITLDDPLLASDTGAWLGAPPDHLAVAPLTESSVSIAADGEDVVVALESAELAVLAYRWHWRDGAFERGPRTLVSPAIADAPYLPIGGSYDDFDAVISPYLVHLGVDASGRAFVATFTARTRVGRHNAVLGTHLDLLRRVLYPRENTSDALVVGIDRDGTHAFDLVVGTVDVEDELFGIAVGPERVAVLGRSRRELGRDNTELHAMIAELDHDGTPLGTTTFDGEGSALAQAGLYDGAALFVGGTEGWQQNPSGRSVFVPGHPFLVRLEGGVVTRLDGLVPHTEPASELRALARGEGVLLLGGHERGPLTHTGDSDRTLIRSDAWWVATPQP